MIPHSYVSIECKVDAAMKLRKKFIGKYLLFLMTIIFGYLYKHCRFFHAIFCICLSLFEFFKTMGAFISKLSGTEMAG